MLYLSLQVNEVRLEVSEIFGPPAHQVGVRGMLLTKRAFSNSSQPRLVVCFLNPSAMFYLPRLLAKDGLYAPNTSKDAIVRYYISRLLCLTPICERLSPYLSKLAQG